MTDLLEALKAATVVGIVIGSAYAVAATGLVITYTTSNVFNMAHGAVGMVGAFLFWELSANQGLPPFLALLLVVGVAAPLFGALIERTMMRRLTTASTTVSLTVTVGLFVALIGLAQALWPPAGRRVEPFFPGRSLRLGGVVVTGDEVFTLLLALAVAGALYLLLNRTRTGIAMRAIVDDRDLLALHGAHPERLGQLSWALGSALAVLAGVLMVRQLGLEYFQLTLLVINAYAAAILGRLRNLPRTIIGAMILGLMVAYYRPLVEERLPQSIASAIPGVAAGARAALPTIFLFVVMVLLPHGRLRSGQLSGAPLVRVPSWRRTITSGALLLAVVAALTLILDTASVAQLGQSLVFATIMLSLVALTGYGGDVSLGQMTFVGIGALVVAKGFGTFGLVPAIVAAVVAGLVGALVGLPALRLRGLYLGLGTLAFAVAMDKLVFEAPEIGFAFGGSMTIERPELLSSERAFTLVVALAFVLLAAVVLGIRRSRFGRFVLASRDSPAACGTLGLNITRTRVALFAVAATIAGLAGALYGGMFVSVGPSNFTMFQNLPLLLLAVVGGITSVTGALLGGLAIGLMPLLQELAPALGGVVYLVIGAAAISLGRNPNGIAGWLFQLGGRVGKPLPPASAPEPAARAAKEVPVVGAA